MTTEEAEADPYKLLSLPNNASPDQIRRAYKKACLRYHPDKHPPGEQRSAAEVHFKAISRAYTQLCERRRSAPPPRPDPDPADQKPFPFDPYFDFFTGGVPHDPVPDREVDLPLTLEELFAGCVKRRRLRNAPDAPVLTISVKPGYRPGDRVRFKTIKQDAGPPADVVFILSQKPHQHFVVDGDDLRITMRVHLVDALAGAVLIVRGLDGADVKVRVDSVIHPGYVHKVDGRGMPRRTAPTERGDLLVAFDIIFPKRVEADDRSAVRDLFARLDAHSDNRMGMRRSSSLFMSRQTTNILNHRRASTTSPMPPVVPDESPSEDHTERRARGRRRFASIFR